MEWISVKDRSPDDSNVIVAYRFGVAEVKFIDGKFVLKSDWYTEIPGVTHWMPLPEPPKSNE